MQSAMLNFAVHSSELYATSVRTNESFLPDQALFDEARL